MSQSPAPRSTPGHLSGPSSCSPFPGHREAGWEVSGGSSPQHAQSGVQGSHLKDSHGNCQATLSGISFRYYSTWLPGRALGLTELEHLNLDEKDRRGKTGATEEVLSGLDKTGGSHTPCKLPCLSGPQFPLPNKPSQAIRWIVQELKPQGFFLPSLKEQTTP